MRYNKIATATLIAVMAVLGQNSRAFGQGYGTDVQNVMFPASGGMAGASTALPQDVPSAIFGNPATLAQFHGTQFTMGGGWTEGYPTVTNDGSINGGTPLSVTSRNQGFVGSGIGVTQDLCSVGVPGTVGMGLAGLSGVGAEYRGMAPGTILNDDSSEYMVLGLNVGGGFQLNDQFSVGAAITLGTGFEQLGFIGPITSSAMVNAYALRGTIGLDYALNDCNTIGFYYQSKMDFKFPNAVRFGGNYYDMNIDQPDTFGIGIANRSLMDGNLLISVDGYYKLWQDAALWQDVMVNQWAVAVGAQLTQGKIKYRVGYSWNSNPLNQNVGSNLDGFPVLQQNVQLFQAANVPLVNQNRITGGIGRADVLIKGLDLDAFAGGLFKATGDFGTHTEASLAMYYVGVGLTWRFDSAVDHQ